MRQLLLASLLLTSASAFAEIQCAESAAEFPNKPALVAAFGNVNPFAYKWSGPAGTSISPDKEGAKTEIELSAMGKMGARAMAKTSSDENTVKMINAMLAAVDASPDSRAPFALKICIDEQGPYLDQLNNKRYFNKDMKSVPLAMPGMSQAYTFTRADAPATAK